jgi:trehalose/maltose hydrolase-like predicted phosphorylase
MRPSEQNSITRMAPIQGHNEKAWDAVQLSIISHELVTDPVQGQAYQFLKYLTVWQTLKVQVKIGHQHGSAMIELVQITVSLCYKRLQVTPVAKTCLS